MPKFKATLVIETNNDDVGAGLIENLIIQALMNYADGDEEVIGDHLQDEPSIQVFEEI